ncbi:MAG: hypothetical protein NTX86_00630 [Candidatus Dependentiae bacterium]|nr:hypothetical protein [Candidatus Dependentiae bacterium]
MLNIYSILFFLLAFCLHTTHHSMFFSPTISSRNKCVQSRTNANNQSFNNSTQKPPLPPKKLPTLRMQENKEDADDNELNETLKKLLSLQSPRPSRTSKHNSLNFSGRHIVQKSEHTTGSTEKVSALPGQADNQENNSNGISGSSCHSSYTKQSLSLRHSPSSSVNRDFFKQIPCNSHVARRTIVTPTRQAPITLEVILPKLGNNSSAEECIRVLDEVNGTKTPAHFLDKLPINATALECLIALRNHKTSTKG